MTAKHEMSAEDFRQAETKKGAEKVWQRRIVNAAKSWGWTVFHPLQMIGSDPGYPDLTCLKPGFDPLWIEVKGPRGRIAEAQVTWLDTINQTRNALAIVAYPEDLAAVEELLAGRQVEIYDDPKDPVLRVRISQEL